MASYGTEAGFAAYVASIGGAAPTGAILPALVRGASYIDGKYGRRFPGVRAGGFGQALAWPRVGAASAEGFSIPSDVVPVAVVNAAYEAALRELSSPGSLSPDYVSATAIKREKVDKIETEYAVSANPTAADNRPVITVIDEMLAGLLTQPIPAVLVV